MPPPYGGWNKQDMAEEADLSRQRLFGKRDRLIAEAEAARKASDMVNANNEEPVTPKSPKKTVNVRLPPLDDTANGATTASSGDENNKDGRDSVSFSERVTVRKSKKQEGFRTQLSYGSLVEELNAELLNILRSVDSFNRKLRAATQERSAEEMELVYSAMERKLEAEGEFQALWHVLKAVKYADHFATADVLGSVASAS